MKVLVFVTQFYQLSGTEKLAMNLSAELVSRGHEVEILSMYSSEIHESVSQAEKNLLDAGISKVSYMDLPLRPGVKDLLAGIIKFRKILKEHHYDFVEMSFMGPMIIALWASIGIKTNLIGGVHAVFDKNLHNTRKHKLWRLSVRYGKPIQYYAISNVVAKAWEEFSGLNDKRITVVYNAIEEKFFNAQSDNTGLKRELDIPEGGRLVLFVGSLLKYKGIDVLIDALGPICKEKNLYILLVGESGKNDDFLPGGQGFFEAFKENIEKNSWLEHVKFLNNRKDVDRLMASSDVLAHPARTEGFGLVLAEALAIGLPIVATRVGGIPEVVADTQSILVDVEDSIQLREAIVKILIMNEEEKESLAKLGRAKAESFRLSVRTDRILSMFN